MKMRCPHCTLKLEKHFADGVLYHSCPQCHGLVMTKYGLAAKASREVVDRFWREARAEGKTSQNPCPSCARVMNLGYVMESPSRDEIDICFPCHMLWLDHGEYESTSAAPKSDPAKKPLPSLEARIAMAKLQAETIAVAKKQIVEYDAPSGPGIALVLLGLPVEFEPPPLARAPVATLGVLIVVFFVSLLGFFRTDFLPIGLFRVTTDYGQMLLTSLGSFFFHADPFHLVGNLYFLWIFGDDVENELSIPGFFALLVLATLMGNAFYAVSPNAATVPVLGASGGISGLVAFYLFRFPYRKFSLVLFRRIVRIDAWLFALFFFGKDAFGAILQYAGIGSVSHLSHLGGAAAGILFAVWSGKSQK